MKNEERFNFLFIFYFLGGGGELLAKKFEVNLY